MPVPFDSPSEADHSGAVAWLRFVVEEDDGGGVRAALFETSPKGEPLAFRFTRMSALDPSIGPVRRAGERRDGAAQSALASSLVGSMLRSAVHAPALALCLADEIPARTLTDELCAGLPVFRIESESGGPAGRRHRRPLWTTDQPGRESDARRTLDEITRQADSFEPFERAAEGLAVAFTDPHVRGLAFDPGLALTVSLSSPPPRAARSATLSAIDRGAVQSQERSGLTLAERLWAVLAAPNRPGRLSDGRAQRYLDHDRSADGDGNVGSRLKWHGELMPFQQEGVSALLDMDRLLLADDMGLGKTIQAIAALRILKERGEIGSCLVVAPAGLLDQWRREITKWAPDMSAIIIRGSAADRSWQWEAQKDVTLVSYDVLRSDFGGDARLSARRKVWDVVVADEAQRIKNRNDTSNALKGLKRARSWALTGTPIENHEEELASIMEFVDHDGQSPPRRYRPGLELLMRHRELQLRRKKDEVLDDLPPKLVTKRDIDLLPGQRASYDKAERDGIIYLKSLGAEVGIVHVLELIVRLKQICNADPKTGESSKLEDIRQRLEQLAARGHKALVFSQYANDVYGVGAAAEYLREFAPLTLTGDVPLQQRADVIHRFKTRDEHKALVLSLRAGGLGLNLQEASYVFHLDRWWNPAVERQAEDRSHRIGQTVKVNVIKYSCIGTIEERIDRVLERKQDLFDRLIDDVSLDLSTRMSRGELLGLFGLGRPG